MKTLSIQSRVEFRSPSGVGDKEDEIFRNDGFQPLMFGSTAGSRRYEFIHTPSLVGPGNRETQIPHETFRLLQP